MTAVAAHRRSTDLQPLRGRRAGHAVVQHFESYLGFASALGYWADSCLADVAQGDVERFWPIFGAPAILWGVHFLILRGVKEAAALNTIATTAKIVPIVLFIVFVIGGFRADVFTLNFWGSEDHNFGSVIGQVRNTMLVTVFVFVGIEGASDYPVTPKTGTM
jgi:arginine:ornithine antiporter/lysine permease